MLLAFVEVKSLLESVNIFIGVLKDGDWYFWKLVQIKVEVLFEVLKFNVLQTHKHTKKKKKKKTRTQTKHTHTHTRPLTSQGSGRAVLVLLGAAWVSLLTLPPPPT